MNQTCRPVFEEALLSGYVDGELTQADAQRIRLHLEDCADCRTEVEEMRRIREAAATTPFPVVVDLEWQEAPRSAVSLWSRRVGWLLVVIFLAGAGWLAVQGLVQGSATWFEKALVGALAGGVVALFASVLLDRLKALKSDRYRRVQK